MPTFIEESVSNPVIFWFRRDLRLADNPALCAAARAGAVIALFVVDPDIVAPVGLTRAAYVAASVAALRESIGGRLVVRIGDPRSVVPEVAREAGAECVYASADVTPRSRARDRAVAEALGVAGRQLITMDSPYVVEPGTVRQASGAPYRVFGAFRRSWEPHLGALPPAAPEVDWVELDGVEPSSIVQLAARRRPAYFTDLADEPAPEAPLAGERAGHAALDRFLARVDDYGQTRDQPGLDATSRLSPFLHVGALHPRTVLAATDGPTAGRDTFRTELGWREFYADVLFHQPDSAWRALQPRFETLRVDRDSAAVARFRSWARGETGFPLVDAGMRQLLAEGWMHNRVRMVTASFLVKHLHVDWRWGASWFLWRLVDGDVASNQHGWQWTAGSGTDAAPFHRIFSPTRQAERFDPRGIYVRRYVPELAALTESDFAGANVETLVRAGYRAPMVDAGVERRDALARFAETRPVGAP